MELNSDDPTALARAALGPRHFDVTPFGTGHGNRTWLVTDDGGDRFVLKVGPLRAAAKWRSANEGRELAAAIGVPSPRLRRFLELPTALVRVFDWIDGDPAARIASDPAAAARFGSELGHAVARLHELHPEQFSSRLDESAPAFTTWDAYVAHRLAEVRRRCEAAASPEPSVVERAAAAITDLASAVSTAARPTLCHRDLHPDNLLVDDRGALVAILDWDMAEVWDQAGDSFKLRSRLFPEIPGSEDAFTSTYLAAHPELPRWEERTRLVDLLETLNSVANAALQRSTGYGAVMSRRLHALLD